MTEGRLPKPRRKGCLGKCHGPWRGGPRSPGLPVRPLPCGLGRSSVFAPLQTRRRWLRFAHRGSAARHALPGFQPLRLSAPERTRGPELGVPAAPGSPFSARPMRPECPCPGHPVGPTPTPVQGPPGESTDPRRYTWVFPFSSCQRGAWKITCIIAIALRHDG